MITQIRKQIIPIVLLVSGFWFLISLGYAQNFKGKTEAPISISRSKETLEIGEVLEYSVEWLGIPVGRIALKVEDIVSINNRPCYHIVGRAIPNKFFQRLYDMEYKVETYIDTEFLYPLHFEKVRRIKNTFTYVTIEFDHKKNEALYNYYTPNGPMEVILFPSQRKDLVTNQTLTIKIPPQTQDLLSSLYYFRMLKIKEEEHYPINISYHSQNWLVKIKVDKPFLREIRKVVPIAVFSVSPVSDLNNFILGRCQTYVEFSADSQRIPISFVLRTAMGPIRGIIKRER